MTTVGNVDAQLGNTSQSVLTGATPSQITLLKASCFNNDSAAHTITVNRVGPGGSPTSANQLIGSGISIGGNATVVLPLAGQTLTDGQSLYASADTGGVVTLSIGYAQ